MSRFRSIKQFIKMEGLGNDFIIAKPNFFDLNNIRSHKQTYTPDELKIIEKKARIACHRNFGIGADGIMLISQNLNHVSKYKMTVVNSDGTISIMCGNGLRCAAAYLFAHDQTGPCFTINTDWGDLNVKVQKEDDWNYQVSASLAKGRQIKPYTVFNGNQDPIIQAYLKGITAFETSVGDSHVSIYLNQQQFDRIAKCNAYESIFNYFQTINRVNVNFCQIVNQHQIKVVTFEVGTGLTYACGTGSSASVYTAFSQGRLDNQVKVQTRGGDLKVTIKGRRGQENEIEMSGPAKVVFEGQFIDRIV